MPGTHGKEVAKRHLLEKGVRSMNALSPYRGRKDTDSILTLEGTEKARAQVLLVSLLRVKDRSSIPTLACCTIILNDGGKSAD